MDGGAFVGKRKDGVSNKLKGILIPLTFVAISSLVNAY
jgi:hypothetical protein